MGTAVSFTTYNWLVMGLVTIWQKKMMIKPCNVEATLVQSTRMQRFLKPYKPCHVGIHWKAFADNHQMSTHLPGFQSFFWI